MMELPPKVGKNTLLRNTHAGQNAPNKVSEESNMKLNSKNIINTSNNLSQLILGEWQITEEAYVQTDGSKEELGNCLDIIYLCIMVSEGISEMESKIILNIV